MLYCTHESTRLGHAKTLRTRSAGTNIQHALSGLGYAAVKDVRQGKFFVLNLDGWNRDEAQKQLERISKEVLTNPVIEEYRFEIVE